MTTKRRRVLVCGGRDFSDWRWLCDVLDEQHRVSPIAVIIHGAARGADSLADRWSLTRNVARVAYPADWQRHGKAAGPIRNQRMLDDGKPDTVIAFPGGTGTADMVTRASRYMVSILDFRDGEKA